jgi:hypothetical protein
MKTYRDEGKMAREAPRTLECWLRDGDKGRWIRAVYVKLAITVMACVFIANTGARLATIPAALLGLVWSLHDVRRRRGEGLLLRVQNRRLHVERRLGGEPIDVGLDELHEVRLDTKGIEKNLNMARADGVNTVFGMDSKHAIGLDVSRIELVTEDESILLANDYISHSLCADSLRSIRLFLRAHGWKPIDERAELDPS